jgi:hypothetical protein
MTVWPQPRVLARGDDRTAPLTDLAGGVRFVVLRIEVLHLPIFLVMLLDLALTQVVGVRWRDTTGLPPFLAIPGPEVRPYSHRSSSSTADDPSLTPIPAARSLAWVAARIAV